MIYSIMNFKYQRILRWFIFQFLNKQVDISIIKMQQLLKFRPTFYFAIGNELKSSLIAQFCRQNKYIHLKNPVLETLKLAQRENTIIEAKSSIIPELQKIFPQLQLIVFGNQFEKQDKSCILSYQKIGKCKKITSLTYQFFRKTMYPNLIFFYGPNSNQNNAASTTLAINIQYQHVNLPQNANSFINNFQKTVNYVVQGCFTTKAELTILQQYFNIKIIHLHYNRVDLPDQSAFFDTEFEILPFLKSKPYYLRVNGSAHPIQVMDEVGIGLCPELIYVTKSGKENQTYLRTYVKETDGLVLNIHQIQSINKRKNLPLALDVYQKSILLNEIIFKNLNRKQIILADFPFTVEEVVHFENLNRKFKKFIDLRDKSQYKYNSRYISEMYFLQQQKYFTPDVHSPLSKQLSDKIQYWIVSGPACSGKSTVAKYISTQFSYKLVQFQPYLASIKQKLLAPEDGEELPVRKIIAHFKQIISTSKTTYVFDGFPYIDKDLEAWVAAIGSPSVLHLNVEEPQLVKRTRKKNQADLNAEVGEEQSGKIKETIAKSTAWVNKVHEIASQAKIFKLNYNMAIIVSEEVINSILKPRIFLVQKHEGIIFQNIALKYGMDFISLLQNKLKDCAQIIKKCKSRDIILCYYSQDQQKLVSEDLYWIEKNIGTIRYLGICNGQPIEVIQEKLVLQKPVVAEKPVKAEGEEEVKQEEGEEVVKKGLDIYQFQWTKPTFHKNLSQWFLQLKKSVIKRKNTPKDCYAHFEQVIKILNNEKSSNVYEIIG